MGYRKIPNLYKDMRILQFRKCYALEKIHGTSAHVRWDAGIGVRLHPGGETLARFEQAVAKFGNLEIFEQRCVEKNPDRAVLYGEAYGGKMQGMRETYGNEPCFTVFEVKIDKHWLDVEAAEVFAMRCGFEFTPYVRIDATVEEIDKQRDADSIIAQRRGMVTGKMREGVVLRPPFEFTLNDGGRILAKHKRAEFLETRTPRVVGADVEVLKQAQAIANEWVTPMRLDHVLQDLSQATGIEHTGDVVRAMLEDIRVEGEGEIEWTPAAKKAVGHAAAKLWKERIREKR